MHRHPFARLIVAAAAFCVASAVHAQTIRAYEDQLENGWQNWSWATTDLGNTTYAYAGAKSIQVTYTGGWQGMYLHTNSLPAKYFRTISFYVNGGTTNGRSVSVAAIVNGSNAAGVDLNAYVAGGKVLANKWKLVTIPLADLHVGPTDNFEGFWLQESTGSSQPPFWIDQITLNPYAAPTKVTVKVAANSKVRTVDSRILGINTAVWDNDFASATCKSRIAESGVTTLRFPGGSLSDTYHWKTNTTDGNTWTWTTSFDTFAGVAKGVSAQAFITVNYGSGNSAEAAQWVAYSNITKKYGFKYWEVGNENYGTWESDNHTRKNDPYTYAGQFVKYYQQMKAKDPTIKVGAVANPGEDTFVNFTDRPATNPRTGAKHNGWTPVMLATMKKLGVTPDFLVYHRYPQNEGTECDFSLLQTGGSWATDLADLRQQLTDYLGAAGANVELTCTENNSTPSGHQSKQMTSLINGLFLADSVGTVLQTECNAYIWWDLINGQDFSGNNGSWLYGWRNYGDYGMMSPSPTFDRYPQFYVQKLLSKFTAGGDSVVTTTSTYGLLTAYSTKRADGSVRVMLVNKSPNATLSTDIAFTGFKPAGTAQCLSYGIEQDEAARTGAGSPDIVTSTLTGVTTKTNVSVAPYSVTVFVFTPSTGV